MSGTPLIDAGAREAIKRDLEATLIVEAAAGTGKTTELVGRVLALLLDGRSLSRIVCVTFTEKAAGEMKLRLRSEIEKARQSAERGSEARSRLDHALEELEAAHIGTIHGFCADLLRERPVEACVDPMFEMLDEDGFERLFDAAFERWFQGILAEPPEGVRRMLRRQRSGDRDGGGAREALRRAGMRLVEQRDFDATWRREPFDRAASIDRVVETLEGVAALADKAEWRDSWIAKSLIELERITREIAMREAVRPRDHDALEEELRSIRRGRRGKFWNWKGGSKMFGDGLSRAEVIARRDAAKAELDRVCDLADADLAACLHGDLGSLVKAYEDLKRRAGKLDFLDLLVLARDLVRDNQVVRNELQERYTHFLIDEFQDTDPLQAEIILLLAANDPGERDYVRALPVPGKLFLVGDPKQSIYRFRRADVTLYEATKKRLVSHGARLEHLSTSFRSAPSIQTAVNAAFAPRMEGSEDGSQASYVALRPFRGELTSQPTVIALPVPRPYAEYGKVTDYSIDLSCPDAVGAFVHWLIAKSGWTTTERGRPDVRVPIEARHVCLLFKRFVSYRRDVTQEYVRALEARRIPHVLVGGRSFHAREEILAVRNALAAVEWPDDELSVFATLRGPFFAVSDDALMTFRSAYGGIHPFRRLDTASIEPGNRDVAEALTVIQRLHSQRNRRPIADTIADLLESTRAHAGVAIWPSGEQALANLFRIQDQARRFESAGATSFRSFVRRLEADAERGGSSEAPIVEEGTDGVRIMTVHRAKGLEFPVVILADPTCPATTEEPSRYVDSQARLWSTPLAGCVPIELAEHRAEVLRHDAEESVRLLYVATTRARELLVVPAVGDGPIDGWLWHLNPVIYPPDVARRDPAPPPAGLPAFGDDTVLDRPESANRGPESAVRPGVHRPQSGTHTVVWWDPALFLAGVEQDVGIRQQLILKADEGGVVASGSERAHADWQSRRKAVVARGALPAVTIAIATDPNLDRASFDSIEIDVESTPRLRGTEARGKRFGALVHAILATVDLAADRAAITRTAASLARSIRVGGREIEDATDAVVAALAHPVLVRARNAEQCRRESPVTLRLADGTLVEGVLDLAFRETGPAGACWIVVDFKTDAESLARRESHRTQLAVYAQAVAAATGEPARGLLLLV